MNLCNSYNIPCPFKLSDDAPVPCIGSQHGCDAWRKRYVDLKEGKR